MRAPHLSFSTFVLIVGLLACGGSDGVEDSGVRPEASVGGDATVDAAHVDADADAGSVDGAPADASGPTRTPKSLVIALDGVRPDALAHANTPNYDALIQGTWQTGYQGAYSPLAQNLYDAATVSGPNHVTIMTGGTGAQHGVSGNGDIDGGDFDTYRHYLRLIEEADSERNTATLFTWTPDLLITSGADLVINASDAANVANAVAILGQTYTPGEGALFRDWAEGTDPDAIFLFLDDGDHAGHAYGFEISVPEYLSELEELDAQLGQLLSAIAARPTFATEAWQIIMTSDHGGYHTGHGGASAAEHTIPFLVASRSAEQGRLPAGTSILDVVPTVLTHMGVSVPAVLKGTPRGGELAAAPPARLDEGLIRYYRFEGDLLDSAEVAAATIGRESDLDPTLHATGGRFGGYVDIDDAGGGAGAASYLTVGAGDDLDFGAGTSFTVTLWFRAHGVQSGDPVILGNKDWVSGGNPGWLVLANEGGDNSFGSNYASTREDRIDVEDIDYSDTGWWFLAAVYQAGSVASLYAGDASGGLRWIAYQARGVESVSGSLPVNIGQDGTGTYAHNLDGDVDDLAMWRRALAHEEILRLYAEGAGAELEGLRRTVAP